MNNPSKISELQELEHWKTKFDTASSATEGFFSKRWLAKKMFGLTDEEFLRNQREMFYDRRFEASLEVVAEETQAAAATEAGGVGAVGQEAEMAGDMGGDLGGDLGAELGGETEAGGEPEGAEVSAVPEEGGLLAEPPGKRDDKSKGKVYTPVNVDGRGHSGRVKGMKASYSRETGRNTPRNVFKGAPYSGLDGASSLLGLGKGLFESETPSYIEEERKLFEVNKDIKVLISDLKLRNKKENTTKTFFDL